MISVRFEWSCGRGADLWRQVASVAGSELVEGLCADVAAPERLGGDDVVELGEGLLHGGADRGRLVAHLETCREKEPSHLLG